MTQAAVHPRRTTVPPGQAGPLRILHVCPSFHPATRWGGPIVSTRAICDGVAGHDVAITVLTTDAAGPDRRDRLDVGRGAVRFPAGYDVIYARRIAGRDVSAELLARLRPLMRRADVVHLTGTYSFPTLPTLALAKLLDKPLLWSPRGALQARREWAAADSRRKVLFEAMCRAAMPRRAMLHATSEAEAAHSMAALPGVPAVVVPNAVDLPEPAPRRHPASGKKLLFLSRLHPKKGLETLLDALALLPAEVTLDVCGTGEPAYLVALHGRAEALGLGARITFSGHVGGAAKTAVFLDADIFVLPSYSENFGIVVAEALAHALPVVTTTITPWTQTVAAGCGLSVPPGRPDALADALRTLLRRTPGELAAMGAAGRRFVAARYGGQAIAARMLEIYLELAA